MSSHLDGVHWRLEEEDLMPLAPREYAEEDHGERAIGIISRIALTDEAQARGRQALRRAITVRRLCADGMYDAFVSRGRI